MSDTHWPNIAILKKFQSNEAKFIFEQAEKQVRETSDAGNLVVSRSTFLITIIAGLTIGLVSYTINRVIEKNGFDYLSTTSVYTIFYLLANIVLLAFNLTGKKYHIIGSEPKSLAVEDFTKTPDDERLTHLYVSELVNYQKRIVDNKNTNERRWKLFNISLILVVSTPLFLIIVYASLLLIRP